MVLLAAAPGLADRASLHDRNDAFGPLDIRTITQGHSNGARRMLMHRVDTYGTWDKSTLHHEGSFIHLLFTTDNDNRPERVLVIHEEHHHLLAEMHAWSHGGVGETTYGRAGVARANLRSVTVTFRRSLLGSGVAEYGWHVDTQYHRAGDKHCGTKNGVVIVCPDSSPNDTQPYSYMRHEV